MSEILISHDKLQAGFQKCQSQIEALLDASDLLFNSKKYLAAFPLAILAYEEIAKLRFIGLKLTANEGISKKEWDKLTGRGSHRSKLTASYLFSQQRFVGREKAFHETVALSRELEQIIVPPTFEEATTVNPNAIMRFEKLDKLKQQCFYVGWNGKKWTTFAELEESQQEALVYVNLIQVKLELNILIVHNKHPIIFHSGPRASEFKDEPLHKVIGDLIKIKQAEDYQNKSKIARMILDKQVELGKG